MVEYNASDTRHIKRAAKAAKQADADRKHVVLKLMSDPAGRSYMYDRLSRCHCFNSSFALSALAMAFAEGERNIGLQDLRDCMAFAPDQYIAMLREASDKDQADGRRDHGDRKNGNGDDRGSDSPAGSVDSDYTPGDGEDGDDATA